MLKPEQIKAKIILANTTQTAIAERIGISKSRICQVIKNARPVIIFLCKETGITPFQITDSNSKKKPDFPLSPREIRAKLILEKISQTELAKKTRLSRSQVSTIINLTQEVAIQLMKEIGENPFQMTENELKRCKKVKKPIETRNQQND
jgi:plasmid maintenance system antidote protein VapI